MKRSVGGIGVPNGQLVKECYESCLARLRVSLNRAGSDGESLLVQLRVVRTM